MNLGARLRLVRLSKGINIKDLEEKTGIKTYNRIEVGAIDPKFNQILTICEFLNIKVWDLLAEELNIKYKEL